MKLKGMPLLVLTLLLLSACNAQEPAVQITDIAVGEGDVAGFGSQITVHYTGWLYHADSTEVKGDKFDSSLDRNAPFQLVLGLGQVIPGWDQGLEGMMPGGKRELIIPPELAYRDRNDGGPIPPNSTLLFEVEMLDAISLVDSVGVEDMVVGTGAEATPGSLIKVHYTGWLFNADSTEFKGAKFDSSVDRGEMLELPIARSRVIPGWDLGIPGMKIGGQRRLTIPPQLAYGDRDLGVIPPNSTLVFDVELFEVVDPETFEQQMKEEAEKAAAAQEENNE